MQYKMLILKNTMDYLLRDLKYWAIEDLKSITLYIQ